MYAVISTGGKQYRVTEGQTLDVERLGADEGAEVSLRPVLVVDGEAVLACRGLRAFEIPVEARHAPAFRHELARRCRAYAARRARDCGA